MPYTSDDAGIWNQLGFVTPIHDQWLVFPELAVAANATFRAQIACNDFAKINSFCYIRSRYRTQTTDQETMAIRVYPKSHPEGKFLIELPPNAELLDRGVYSRSIEIKKVIRWRKWYGIVPDSSYSITLEELA